MSESRVFGARMRCAKFGALRDELFSKKFRPDVVDP